jgi:hypothetical protein
LEQTLSEGSEQAESGDTFVEPSVMEQLCQPTSKKHDLAKIVRFCEELNSSFASGNYLASTLLIRALLNHVPPIFGHTTFLQVVSQAARSVKELLKPLEEIARDVADLHTHSVDFFGNKVSARTNIVAVRFGLSFSWDFCPQYLPHKVIIGRKTLFPKMSIDST